ncbi:MAG TPA: transcriptional regulator [Deltaproteobacteria bacterium]|nr:transcriptional regulator [Candidatus Bathyarchaeota archaeon]HEC31402.1 transcriptional regulator [Deltaproteobacteria bacterium]HEX69569.1 transcriptional regulator [Candidatus Bathyarchaeota archaeon]
MSKKLVELAADIIQAQATHTRMSADEISEALLKTFETLRKIKNAEETNQEVGSIEEVITDTESKAAQQEEETQKKIPIDPKDSIQRTKVICLECGAEFKQLSANHLKSHGLTLREYKKKYGFPLSQPLSAKNLTAKRKRIGKKRGLPPQLIEARKKRAKAASSK